MFTRRAFVKLASAASTLGMAIAAHAKKKKKLKKITGRILEVGSGEFLLADGDYDNYGDEWTVVLTDKTKFFTKKEKKKSKKKQATSDILEEFAKVKVAGPLVKDTEFTMTANSVTRLIPDYDYY